MVSYSFNQALPSPPLLIINTLGPLCLWRCFICFVEFHIDKRMPRKVHLLSCRSRCNRPPQQFYAFVSCETDLYLFCLELVYFVTSDTIFDNRAWATSDLLAEPGQHLFLRACKLSAFVPARPRRALSQIGSAGLPLCLPLSQLCSADQNWDKRRGRWLVE